MELTVVTLGLEPAIQILLQIVLAREQGLRVAGKETLAPDVVLFGSRDVESAREVRIRYPNARLIAFVNPWCRPAFADVAIDEYVDGLTSYQDLIDKIRYRPICTAGATSQEDMLAPNELRNTHKTSWSQLVGGNVVVSRQLLPERRP